MKTHFGAHFNFPRTKCKEGKESTLVYLLDCYWVISISKPSWAWKAKFKKYDSFIKEYQIDFATKVSEKSIKNLLYYDSITSSKIKPLFPIQKVLFITYRGKELLGWINVSQNQTDDCNLCDTFSSVGLWPDSLVWCASNSICFMIQISYQ